MMESVLNILQKFIISPKVDTKNLEENFQHIKKNLPIPVFWLLGKAQSGKTSLIRGLTGDSRAVIGDGIRPCTRTAYVYEYPTPETCFIKFLDTRGLGEINYDPSEDISVFKEQTHLLMVVMKAMDHAQLPVIQALKEIRQKRPDWPLIVVQTTLHEGYPSPDIPHVIPYPFDQDPIPATVPMALTKSLMRQRELFKGMKAIFVPVDFTLPEDGYEPVYYGIEALWQAIENTLPLGLAQILKQASSIHNDLKDTYSKAVQPHIIAYAIAAGGAGVIPVPFLDVPLVTLVQAKMFQTIASIYDQEINAQLLSEIAGAIGVGLLSQLGKRELVKLVPGYGVAVSSIFNAATTYALGQTLSKYFSYLKDGGLPDTKLLKKFYDEQFRNGKELLKQYLITRKDNQ